MGNDTYLVDSPLDVVFDVGGVDHVFTSVDYALGADIETLSGMGARGLTLKATRIALLDKKLKLTEKDFFVI